MTGEDASANRDSVIKSTTDIDEPQRFVSGLGKGHVRNLVSTHDSHSTGLRMPVLKRMKTRVSALAPALVPNSMEGNRRWPTVRDELVHVVNKVVENSWRHKLVLSYQPKNFANVCMWDLNRWGSRC